jgi:hypothetical protein
MVVYNISIAAKVHKIHGYFLSHNILATQLLSDYSWMNQSS